MSNDPFIIAGSTLSSRLFVGSARYPNQQIMLDAMAASAPCSVRPSARALLAAATASSAAPETPIAGAPCPRPR